MLNFEGGLKPTSIEYKDFVNVMFIGCHFQHSSIGTGFSLKKNKFIYRLKPKHIKMENIIQILKSGGTILYPTGAIWGIGCDATNIDAINKIFEIKKREKNKSMIILVENEKRLQDLVDVPEMAWEIMDLSEKPVTLVYQNPKGLPKELLAEDGSIGIRLVKDLYCKKLITKLNKPLVSTSANFSGDKSPLKFSDISKEIVDLVDFAVEEDREKVSQYSGSSVIKIWSDNKIKVLRE